MIITSVQINTDNIFSKAENREFVVSGEPGAVFSMTVTNGSNHFYNFSEDLDKNGQLKTALAFSATPAKLVQKKLNEFGVYTGSILFPTVSADDEYEIIVYADGHYNTTFEQSLSKSNIYKLPIIYQFKDTTLTFSLSSAANSSDYNNLPNDVTSIGFENRKASFSINWPVTLSNDDLVTHFVIAKQPSANDFTFTTTKDTKTAGSSSVSLELKDIKGLSAGMAVSGTGIASGATIKNLTPGFFDQNKSSDLEDVYSIPIEAATVNGEEIVRDSSGGTAVISAASTFVADRTLTFTGKGPGHSDVFNNTDFTISNFKVTIDPVVTTTDLAVDDSLTIPLASTVGIKAAETVIMSGIGVIGTPHVDAVSNGVNITASAKQTIENGQTITFTGSSRSATITADVSIESHGVDDLTLTLALDNILTIE